MNGNALGYLLRVKWRNFFRDLLKRPGRLVLLIILIAAFAGTIIGGNEVQNDPERKVQDISVLCALLNALCILIFSTAFMTSISSGGSFFKMQDINFIFPAPIGRNKVLFYGLIQQMGVNLFIGFFILFQYTTLRSNFDITIWGLLLVFLAYTLSAFVGQCFGLFIYTFISDSEKKKRLVKLVYLVLVAAVVAYVDVNILNNRSQLLTAIAQYATAWPVKIFPFAGWLGAFADSLFHGEILFGLLWLALTAGVFFVALYIVSKSNRDYYEDVISSAEATQSAVVSAKENAVPEAAPKNIKVGKTGFDHGIGASVFFFKHMRENRRSSKLFISPASILYAAMTVVFALIFKGESDNAGSALIGALCFSSYMLIFLLPLGRFNRELFRPYIYLIPESPVKKMFYATLELLPTTLLESAITFIPVAFILQTGPISCILCILVRTSFAMLFTAGNIIVERLWSGSLSKIVGIFVYMFIDIILAAPGFAVALVLPSVGFVLIDATVTSLLLLTVINIPISLLAFFLCRNMLQYSESAA